MNIAKILMLLFIGTAVGCVIWFGLIRDAHYFNRQLSQEDRHAAIVLAKPLPKEPMKIVIKNGKAGCHVIDRADWDADDLWVYYHDECKDEISATTISWKGIAPDGTVVMAGYGYTYMDLDRGQIAEYHKSNLPIDPRASVLEVRALWNNESYRER